MTSSNLATRCDGSQSLVVGAGQAGLVMGYQLRQRGLPFQIVDTGAEIGEVWRKRWDSLKLFTPAQYDALPGMDFPAASSTYPGKDAVADFLHAYATRFELPVSLNTRVTSLRKVDGGYLAETESGTLEASNVVIATGPFQVPRVPPIADRLDDGVLQFHSSAYRSPQETSARPVLVVGGGNTGFQIAEELASHIEVHLAIGSRQTPLPQRILGRDLFWYLEATGLIRKSLESRIGQRLSGRDTLIGSSPRAIRRHGVKLHPRAVDAAGSTVTFSDETKLDAGTVIWATGFRSSWQYTRGSALLGWVKDDAEYIAEQISASRPASPTEARQPAIAR